MIGALLLGCNRFASLRILILGLCLQPWPLRWMVKLQVREPGCKGCAEGCSSGPLTRCKLSHQHEVEDVFQVVYHDGLVVLEPVSRHMEEQGQFLQFAFRWFNCFLIREIPFHLVTRLWDTYLAKGDALTDFLVYIFASFLLTIARAFGASDIIAVDVQDEKLEKAKTFGATATINSKIEDPIEMIKVQVIGSYGGRARQDLLKLVKLAESGIFNLADVVTRKYGFEEAGKAFQDLNQGKIVSRAVVEMM
ncbi:hypothetical protein DKX38_017450 [Salix brachista]|uniref:Rab-GAP TBC domain-containing protein n=1 Tax=Salix brachista TaxID=2182728 RepID=A0A5N5KVB0_9ROSI|nr:hypothetical protein DKX38_017450 [Salix brachista]